MPATKAKKKAPKQDVAALQEPTLITGRQGYRLNPPGILMPFDFTPMKYAIAP